MNMGSGWNRKIVPLIMLHVTGLKKPLRQKWEGKHLERTLKLCFSSLIPVEDKHNVNKIWEMLKAVLRGLVYCSGGYHQSLSRYLAI